ncbi:MAG: hypothetical protein ABEL97_04985 [Salinibacter sp.]
MTIPFVGTMKRDHIIFLVAIAILSAGVADGLHRGVGVPLWAAVPAGLGLWSAFAVRMYHQSRKELAQADTAEEAPSGAEPAGGQ